MSYVAYSLLTCLSMHAYFYAAEKSAPEPAEKKPAARVFDLKQIPILALQRLTSELSQLATTDYNNGLSILQSMIAATRHHSRDCTHHTTQIMASPGGLDFVKNMFGKSTQKYDLVKTSMEKAETEFWSVFKTHPAIYNSSDVTFWTALSGTKCMSKKIFSMETMNEKTLAMASLACTYGNVEVVEYLIQYHSDILTVEEAPTILDLLKMPELQRADIQQELTMFKNAATIRYEYMLHQNPDTQQIRKACPFEECKRLFAEAVNVQKTSSSSSSSTTHVAATQSNTHSSTTSDANSKASSTLPTQNG